MAEVPTTWAAGALATPIEDAKGALCGEAGADFFGTTTWPACDAPATWVVKEQNEDLDVAWYACDSHLAKAAKGVIEEAWEE